VGCLPYFKFYPDDWLSDRKVRRLSPEARALYWDLLATAWKEGGIPADRAELVGLAEWLGVKPRRFDRVWAELEAFWVHGPDGVLVNPRQETERNDALAIYEKRVAAGRQGGRPATANGKHP
jgi:uncharacterized protein YdaU (DUF1376 family)